MKKWFSLSFLFFAVTGFSQPMGNFTGHAVQGKAIIIDADNFSLRMIFYRPDIVRIDFLPDISAEFDSSFVVIRDTLEQVDFRVIDTPPSLEVRTLSLTIVCRKDPLRLSFYDADSKLLLGEPVSGGLTKVGEKRAARFSIRQDHHFYGSGVRGKRLDLKSTIFSCYNTQVFGYHSAPGTMNLNVPFLCTTNGFALYFENSFPGRFDIGATDPAIFEYLTGGGELSFFFICGKTAPEQLKKFTWLTGRQPMPPKWALGYIQSKYGYRNQTQAQDMVRIMRDKKIPCDAIVLDLYWFQHMGDLSWNLNNFPDPFQMMADFLEQGVKTVVITEPYVVEHSTNFAEGAANGYFAKNSQAAPYLLSNWWSCNCDAALLDITNPDARQWWWNQHPHFFGNELAGIWTDLGEPERHPYDMVHYLGSTLKVHNLYNLLWAQTIFNGYSNFRPNNRLFNLTRSGYAGIQRYSVFPWTGDVGVSFYGLAAQIPFMLNAGMSGLAYLHSDIGGFCCASTSPELYIRWLQLATFSGVMRAHGVDYQPQEPWGYGAEAERIAKKFIELRYRLLPYNYSLAYENHQTGMPLARPLFFADSNNTALYDEFSAFCWGEAMLVAPVTADGVRSKTVPLPRGEWVDYWTDQHYSGNQAVTVSAPLDQIPIFIKKGSIIPMQPVMQFVDAAPLDTLYLQLYPQPGHQNQLRLYEDDGATLNYQRGEFALTLFSLSVTDSPDSLQLYFRIGPSIGEYHGKPHYRCYLAVVHHVLSKPHSVFINSIAAPNYPSLAQLRRYGNGYFHDSDRCSLFVAVSAAADSEYVVQVNGMTFTSVERADTERSGFLLKQNYPNPFNSVTQIGFSLSDESQVLLKIFDIAGREIKRFDLGQKSAGSHVFSFDGSQLASGLYFYKIHTASSIASRKFILLK